MSYIKLSELIEKTDDAKQFAMYKRMKAAVRNGELMAVPIEGSVNIARKKSPLTVPEHAMQTDAQDWWSSNLTALSQPRTPSRRVAVTLSDLTSGKHSFDEASARYRDSLQKKPTKKTKR